MATAEKQGLTCPICFELFSKPRKMSVCNHTFCENCLVSHLTNLKMEQELLHGDFQCPLCRSSNPLPAADGDVLKWAQSLLLDKEMILKVNTNVNEKLNTDIAICSPCRTLEKRTVARMKCLNCKESFCKDCCKIRHSTSLLPDHIIIEMEEGKTDIEERETQLMENYLTCSTHCNNVVRFLCKDEDILCCAVCAVVHHRDCSELAEIKTSVTRKDSEILQDKISKLLTYSKSIIETKKSNEAENKKKREKICTSIQEMRMKVNKLFDLLEENTTERCKALTKKYCLAALDDIDKLQVINKELEIFISLIKKSEHYNTSSLDHIILHNLKKAVRQYETTVLEMAHSCKKYGFILEVHDRLGNLLDLEPNDTDEMATIGEEESDAILGEYSERKLFRYCDIKKSSIHKVIVKGSCNEFTPEYRALQFLPNDKLFLADYRYGFCSLVNAEFELVASCNLTTHSTEQKEESRKPYCVTHVKDNTVAISIPTQKKILFVEADEKLTIKGNITTRYTPKALQGLKNGDMAVSWSNPVAFGIIAFSRYIIEDKVYFDRDTTGRVFQKFEHIAVDEERSHIIQPCTSTKTVYCFDFQGNPKFAYMNKLQLPRSVALDGDGNIYVCDESKSNIHIISPDGTAIRFVKEGCPTACLAIGFRHDRTEFAVSNSNRFHRQDITVFQHIED